MGEEREAPGDGGGEIGAHFVRVDSTEGCLALGGAGGPGQGAALVGIRARQLPRLATRPQHVGGGGGGGAGGGGGG